MSQRSARQMPEQTIPVPNKKVRFENDPNRRALTPMIARHPMNTMVHDRAERNDVRVKRKGMAAPSAKAPENQKIAIQSSDFEDEATKV